jgi:hypothetical protein
MIVKYVKLEKQVGEISISLQFKHDSRLKINLEDTKTILEEFLGDIEQLKKTL